MNSLIMRLGVFLPNWVGDTCMATPALRAIAALPELSDLVLIGRPGPLSLLENAPYANHRIAFKPRSKSASVLGRRALVAELRKQRIDTILLMPNSLSSALIARLAGIRRRIGFARDGRSWLLTDRVPMQSTAVTDGQSRSIAWRESAAINYYLHLATQLGCETSNRRMELYVSNEDRTQAKELMGRVGFSNHERLVVLNNSSASASSRLWPTELAVSACRTMAEEGIQVLIHAGPGDRSSANELADAVGHNRVQSMGKVPDLPLGLSRGVLGMADVVVTTDSGVRHIAVALDRNVVSLFGPTNSRLTQTYNVPEIQLEHSLSCRPCLKDSCPLKHRQCMSEISTDSVLHAVRAALKRSAYHAA